ncbi:unnamed protein product [Darwinula stevensoni]|uniref:Uncharacterized protein n=1 Tax=Darwinula stevensoni TaxID=69355 RepID=A0A7R9AF37_9CRUS|nr:unnamed protein product [Darwinula stevensoni]CAG0902529.1 unnamed protein product [Darwinula stevensoni]
MRSRMSLGARESGERRMRAYRSLGDSRGSLRLPRSAACSTLRSSSWWPRGRRTREMKGSNVELVDGDVVRVSFCCYDRMTTVKRARTLRNLGWIFLLLAVAVAGLMVAHERKLEAGMSPRCWESDEWDKWGPDCIGVFDLLLLVWLVASCVLLVAVGIWLAQVHQVALNEETLRKARTMARPDLCSAPRFRPPGYGFGNSQPDGFGSSRPWHPQPSPQRVGTY